MRRRQEAMDARIRADSRREALEAAAKLVETYEGNAWTEEKQTLLDRKAAAIRALAKEPKP